MGSIGVTTCTHRAEKKSGVIYRGKVVGRRLKRSSSFFFRNKSASPDSGVTRVGDTRGGNVGVTPLFFPERPGDLFAHRCHYHCRFLSISLGCHPPQGCHPTTFFYLSDLVSPLFFVNLPTNFFPSSVTPGGCHPGWSTPAPRSDATVPREFSGYTPILGKAVRRH